MSVFDGIKPPEVLFKTSSKYNDSIEVLKNKDVIKLSVNNFVQSYSKNSKSAPHLCWGQLVKKIQENCDQEDVDNILILGLGGATMQHMIREAYPEANMVSVEIDPAIVDIAKKYFDLDSIENHKVIIEDALRVVIGPEEFGLHKDSFDVIVVDTVIGDEFPDLGKSGNFLGAVKKLLIPGGFIIFNRIYLDDYQESVNIFIDYVENFFVDVDTHVVAGHTNSDNILIYGRG